MSFKANLLGILASCLTLVSSSTFAQQVSDATNIDMRWNRTWPAGPYSQVSTGWGVLQTAIPIVSVDGPGNTSIGVSVYHRSNQNTGFYAPVDASPGRGWYLDARQIMQIDDIDGAGIAWYQSGNSTMNWKTSAVVNGVPTYTRRPGCRGDVAPIMSGNQIRGWIVTEQATKTKYYFDRQIAVGNAYALSRYVDTYGNQVTYTFDAQNRVTRITDASGARYIQITYTSGWTPELLSNITLFFPGGSRSWQFYYVNSHLDYIEFPAPVNGGTRPKISFAYDANTNISDLYDLEGYRWHYVYDTTYGSYRGIKSVHPPYLPTPRTHWDTTGTVFNWAINNSGPASDWTRTCTVTDRRGYNWSHVYYNYPGNASFGSPIKETWDPANFKDTYTWNYNDATLLTHVDRRGNTTSYTFDSTNRGLLVSKLDRENWLWQYYYRNDKLVTQIDPTLNRTIFEYDFTTGSLLSTTVDPVSDPFDSAYSKPGGVALKTNYTYTSGGELASQWTGNLSPVVYSNFNVYGVARTVTDPNGFSTLLTFDELNNKLSETPPSKPGVLPARGTTNFSYDNWNRPVRTTLPGGAYTEKYYDWNSNVTGIRDANGRNSTMNYDAWRRLESTVQPVDASAANNIVESYGYDNNSNRISATNGRGKTTNYVYNIRNGLMRIDYPDGTSRGFAWDENNNQTHRYDGQNRLTLYTYDKENRLLTRKYGSAAVDLTNSWRSDGLLGQRVDATGTYTWTYNGAKQLVGAYQPVPNKTVTYTYDVNGSRKTMTVGAQTWTYQYQTDGRFSYLLQTVGRAQPIAQTYLPDGSVWNRTYGNYEQVLRNSYDARGRLSTMSYRRYPNGYAGPWPNESAEVEQQRLEYTYDDVDNVLTYKNVVNGGNSWTTAYTYDWADRLKTETRTGGAASFNFANSYAYDKNGNRTSATIAGSSATYTVDDNDRFLSGGGFTASGYSADGNPGTLAWPGRGNYTFTYDWEQKPVTTVAAGLGTWTNTYDGAGTRVKLVSPSGERRYVYDGATVIAETDATGAILSYHVPDVGYVEGGTQRFYRQNALGSNLSVLDATGAKVSESEFDAYGNEYSVQSGPMSQFGYAGKHGYQTDANDLMLLGARFYVAPLGRFLTQDPIGHKAGLNLYAYCSNNPVGRVDPDGKDWDDIKKWWNKHVTEPTKGWFNALHATAGFISGVGPSNNVYQDGDLQTKQLQNSDIGHMINIQMIESGYMSKGAKTLRGSSGHLMPFINTVLQPSNGTQAQVGGVIWTSTRVGNTVYVHVHNEITLKSLAYHWFGLSNYQGWDRAANGFGPMGRVTQDFYWKVPVPQYWKK